MFAASALVQAAVIADNDVATPTDRHGSQTMEVDEFSDDGFDDLPDNDILELERNAIQLTQVQTKRPPSRDVLPRLSDYGWEEEDDDLDNTEVTNHGSGPVARPVVNNTQHQQQQHQHAPKQQPPSPRHHQPAADPTLPPAARPPIPPQPNPRWNPTVGLPNSAHARSPSTESASHAPFSASPRFPLDSAASESRFARPSLPPSRFPALSPASQPPGRPGDVLSALQQRVRALESELYSAKGEASIIRAKAIKAQQEFDAQLARVKKLNAEQLDKQNRAMEAAVTAEKSATTELQFLQRDMREMHSRSRMKDAAAGGGPQNTNNVTTPRKGAKSWAFADGFDEMDVAVSPSKGQGRGRVSGSVAANVGERTPSKGKRKRPPVESPMAALDISTDEAVAVDEVVETARDPRTAPRTVPAAASPPFEFLQLVLDHGAFHQQPPTFDMLSRFSLPSDPTNTSFSSMIFEKLPMMGNTHRPMQLLVDFCSVIISLWGQCVEEHFWEPIKYLVALIIFTVDLHTTSVAPHLVPTLVPIVRATFLALNEAQRRSLDGTPSTAAALAFLEEHIDTTPLLFLLYTSALACSSTPTELDNGSVEYTSARFWTYMSTDVALMLLAPKQKPDKVIATLELLATSVLPNSIGPITADATANETAASILERVSAKLTEHPKISITPPQRRSVQLAALRTLIACSTSPFGAVQLTRHDNAIPRLVACLSSTIDDLYDQSIPASLIAPPLSPSLASALYPPSSTTPTTALYLIISQSVLLVHRLVTDPLTATTFDMNQKLSLSHGGSQRYHLALGRLAFAEEDLVIDAGIEGDVVEAAHELLEMAVTPDEGETISEAFGACPASTYE